MTAPATSAKKPADDATMRTLFVGMVGAFVIYAIGFALLYLFPGPVGFWLNIGCLVGSLAFVGVWLLMLRGGFRIGKPTTAAQQRAKDKARREREKQREFRMRRSR